HQLAAWFSLRLRCCMQWIAAGLLLNVAAAVMAFAQVPGLSAQSASAAKPHSERSSVTIAGEKLTQVSEVSLADDPQKVRISHDAGVHVARIADVPQNFLQSWQILPKRNQALNES